MKPHDLPSTIIDGPPSMTTCFCRSLRLASVRLVKLYADALAPVGLRPMEFALMAEIARNGQVALQELGDLFLLDRSSLRYRLRPLSEAGFIEIVADPRDRRERRVLLTEAGSARLAAAKPVWEEAQARFERALGTKRAAVLRSDAKVVASAAFAETFGSI